PVRREKVCAPADTGEAFFGSVRITQSTFEQATAPRGARRTAGYMTERTDHDTSAAAAAAAADALVGTRVNKYEIIRVIGRGGMGTVYEAVNTAIGKRVAMKFVDATLARNKDSVAR